MTISQFMLCVRLIVYPILSYSFIVAAVAANRREFNKSFYMQISSALFFMGLEVIAILKLLAMNTANQIMVNVISEFVTNFINTPLLVLVLISNWYLVIKVERQYKEERRLKWNNGQT